MAGGEGEGRMRDLTFGLGLIAIALFGSALDSTGWAGWVAVAGVAGGLVLMLAGGKDNGVA